MTRAGFKIEFSTKYIKMVTSVINIYVFLFRFNK